MLLVLVGAVPLLSGCLQRSTTVGDRFSGSIVVATTPDDPKDVPKLDIPESMAAQVSVSEYTSGPATDRESSGPSPSTTPTEATAEAPSPEPGDDPSEVPPPGETTDQNGGKGSTDQVARVGTRASFTDLTTGQIGQLGEIAANAFGEDSMSIKLAAKRTGDVVRLTGTADLTDLDPARNVAQLTISFGGEVTGTTGSQVGDNTVTWNLKPRETTTITAEAKYADPATAAIPSWSWFVAFVCLAVVLLVARLAFAGRDRSPRPGRPRRTGPSRPGA